MMHDVGRVRTISEMEFAIWQPSLKVITHDHARRFGAVVLERSLLDVALSWRSDRIEPILLLGDQSQTWLAVDQRVACIGGDGQIVVSLGLASPVLNLQRFHDCVTVVCETEIVVFGGDYSISTIQPCSDIPCEIVEVGGVLYTTFDDGRRERLR